MTDRRLQVFLTVARVLSFTKAAESLHMTQPAVTFQIRQLEKHFNTRLFDRTHNRISLTEAGDRVYAYAEKIFDLYGEMDAEVRQLTGEVSGVLALGASTTIAEYMLPTLLGDFKRAFPEVVLRLQVSNTEGIVSMVEANEIDLGVVEAPVLNKNLLVEVWRADRMVVVVPPSHPLASAPAVPVAQLVEFPFIVREEGSGTREVTLDYLRNAGVEVERLSVSLELGNPESIKGAVEAGMGISVLSSTTIHKEVKLATLAGLDLDPPLERFFSFVRQKQKFRNQAMQKLLDFARDYGK